MSALWKYVHFCALNTWLGELLHQCGRGMEAISMWHGSGGMEAQVGFDNSRQVICIVGPSGSHLPLDNTPDIYGVQVRRVCWPIKHSNTMVIEPAFGTFSSVGRCQVLLENEISISIKLVSRRKHESALKFLGRWLRWLWTSENTVDQHQQMTFTFSRRFYPKRLTLHSSYSFLHFISSCFPWEPNPWSWRC